mmetsp:Transcript_27599/g.58653  ORF Transcript_27599/g.58653 Transcript_27599/m.58653 type:complete len:263 (-) Transcript_27599:191-979(-)
MPEKSPVKRKNKSTTSAAVRKRKSRANNPEAYPAERERNRERMVIYRARNNPRKRAAYLKGFLTVKEGKELEAQAFAHKQSLLRDWFSSRNLRFPAGAMTNDDILHHFVSKIELHKIEREVGELEIFRALEILNAEQLRAGASTPLPGVAACASSSNSDVCYKQQISLKPNDEALSSGRYVKQNAVEEKALTALLKVAEDWAAEDEKGQHQHGYQHDIAALLVAAKIMESSESMESSDTKNVDNKQREVLQYEIPKHFHHQC